HPKAASVTSELNRGTRSGAPTRPKQPAAKKGAKPNSPPAYWKFESTSLQRRVPRELDAAISVRRRRYPAVIRELDARAGRRAEISGRVAGFEIGLGAPDSVRRIERL